jgi:hypothetical protein
MIARVLGCVTIRAIQQMRHGIAHIKLCRQSNILCEAATNQLFI